MLVSATSKNSSLEDLGTHHWFFMLQVDCVSRHIQKVFFQPKNAIHLYIVRKLSHYSE